jgi:hypothetical protein
MRETMRNVIAGAVQFNMKKMVLWLFVFSPFIAYSQYLNPEDVDILIDNRDIINRAMQDREKTESDYDDETDTGYSRALEVIDKSYLKIIEDNLEKITGLMSG